MTMSYSSAQIEPLSFNSDPHKVSSFWRHHTQLSAGNCNYSLINHPLIASAREHVNGTQVLAGILEFIVQVAATVGVPCQNKVSAIISIGVIISNAIILTISGCFGSMGISEEVIIVLYLHVWSGQYVIGIKKDIQPLHYQSQNQWCF